MPRLCRAVVAVVIVIAACGADGETEGLIDPYGQARARFMAECLAESGFPDVRVVGSATIYDPTPEESDEFALAEAACLLDMERELPIPEADPENLARFHADLMETAACLQAEGYTISAPPTLDEFLAEQDSPWHPYLEVRPSDPEEWERINRVCPQPS